MFSIQKRKAVSIGIVFALTAAVLEALVDVFPKPLMTSNTTQIAMEPLVITFVIYLANGILFTPFARRSTTSLPKNTMYLLVIIGIVEVLSTIFFLYGLRQTTAVNATILLNSEIIFGVALAYLFLKEKIHKKEVIPISLICSGAIMLPFITDFHSLSFSNSFVVGNSFVLIAGGLLGVGTCLYKYLADNVSLSQIMQYSSFAGAGVSIMLILLFGIQFNVPIAEIPHILFIGIFGIGLSAFCYMIALKKIGAVKTIVVFSSTTIFGVVMSNIVLAESIFPTDIVSIGLILSGTAFLRNKIA